MIGPALETLKTASAKYVLVASGVVFGDPSLPCKILSASDMIEGKDFICASLAVLLLNSSLPEEEKEGAEEVRLNVSCIISINPSQV